MPAASPAVLSLRVTESERELLQAAARNAKTNISDFVRRKALEAAEIDFMMNPVVVIPAEKWDEFEAWLHEPPRDIPALRELARHLPAWKD